METFVLVLGLINLRVGIYSLLSGRRHPSGVEVETGPTRLSTALREAPPSEDWAFADSDGRPHTGWLRRLVRPLDERQVGEGAG